MICNTFHNIFRRTGAGILFGFFLFCWMVPGTVSGQDQDSVGQNDEVTDTIDTENDSYTAPDDRLPDTVILRAVPDSAASAMRKQKAFAYANDPAYWKKEPPRETRSFWDYFSSLFDYSLFRGILITIMIAVLLLVLYRVIISNNLFMFYRPGKRRMAHSDTAFTEIDDDSFDQKIEMAKSKGDYRMATRFLYLKTLQVFNERGLISYFPQGTNYDYITQLGQHSLAQDFAYLTRIYEYVWYGEFPITLLQFDAVQAHFQDLFKSAKR